MLHTRQCTEFFIFVTSVLHWHNPQFDWWRTLVFSVVILRTLDMVVVQIGLWVHEAYICQGACHVAGWLMALAVVP